MPNEMLRITRMNIEEAEKELKKAEELLKRLKLAGEDVRELEAAHRLAKLRLQKWKKAFKD